MEQIMEQQKITKAECEWCGKMVDKNTLEEAHGDVVYGIVCDECINIPPHEWLVEFWNEHHDSDLEKKYDDSVSFLKGQGVSRGKIDSFAGMKELIKYAEEC